MSPRHIFSGKKEVGKRDVGGGRGKEEEEYEVEEEQGKIETVGLAFIILHKQSKVELLSCAYHLSHIVNNYITWHLLK